MALHPLHPITGLELVPLGTFKGRPIWPILGASPDGDGAEGGEGTEGTGDDSGTGSGGPGDDVTRLNEALRKEREARKQFEREAKAGREAAARLAEIEEAGKEGWERELESATATARSEGAIAASEHYRQRIITAEIKAAAGGKLADPTDAVRLLDLDEFDLDDEDNLDGEQVSKAIEKLLKDKPYLAANGAQQGGGFRARNDSGQGAGGDPGPARQQQKVDEARAQMFKTLRIKEPQQTAT